MLRSNAWRRLAPLTLVAGITIFLPVRGNALPSIVESSWQRLVEIFSTRTLTSLFQNAGTQMDPDGKPAPGGAPVVVPGPTENDGVVREPVDGSIPQR